MKSSLYIAIYLFSTLGYSQSSLSSLSSDKPLAPIKSKDSRKISGDEMFPDIDRQLRKAKEAMKEVKTIALAPKSSFNNVETEKISKSDRDELVRNRIPQVQLSKAKVVSLPVKKVHKKSREKVRRRRYSANKNTRYQPPAFTPSTVYMGNSGMTVFTENIEGWEEDYITVPSLSSAYAKVLFGEEVSASKQEWVSAELQWAFLGPNNSVVELTGCRIKIILDSNFNTSKVSGELQKIVCRNDEDGTIFEEKISGKIIDAASEYGGIPSDIIMAGPAKAMALEALNATITSYGKAISFSETTREAVNSDYSSTSVENVSGNKDRYAKGQVLQSAAGFMDYLISFHKKLEPTLALAPGTKVFAVIDETIRIPKSFLKKQMDVSNIKRDLLVN